MSALDDADPVPLGHRFDVVWRGYHRRQVNEYVDLNLRWLTADRDAAMTMVCKLAKLLDESRSHLRRLREQRDRLCRTPLPPEAVGERLRHQVEIARAEASAIVATARARAEYIRTRAVEDTARWAAEAEQRRRQVEDDFQIAMAARRDDVMRRLREYEASCRAEADQLVQDARRVAAGQIASALSRLESLRSTQRHLAQRLRLVQGLVQRTCELVDPLDGDPPDASVTTVDGSATR